MNFRHFAKLLTLVFSCVISFGSMAQSNWPNQPIKIILPFPTGGTVDQISRLLQPHLQQTLGQAIVIETRSGASGSIGTGIAAKSPPRRLYMGHGL